MKSQLLTQQSEEKKKPSGKGVIAIIGLLHVMGSPFALLLGGTWVQVGLFLAAVGIVFCIIGLRSERKKMAQIGLLIGFLALISSIIIGIEEIAPLFEFFGWLLGF